MSFYVGPLRLQAYAVQNFAWLSLPEFLAWLTDAETIDFTDPFNRYRILDSLETISRIAPYNVPPYVLIPNDTRFIGDQAFVYLNNIIIMPAMRDLLVALNYNAATDSPPYADALTLYENAVLTIRTNVGSAPVVSCVVDRTVFETAFALVWTAP